MPAASPDSEVAFVFAGSDSHSSQEGAYHPQNLFHHSWSRLGCQTCLPRAPVQALDVVGQHHAGDGASLREGLETVAEKVDDSVFELLLVLSGLT